ncbi:TetR/AcrR family transcriptional regulator [Micrococcaceae bacterium RIT802]|nr:TetR/AcrR family transcriptional regulator [Micrococcaceae bacterium RIT 802]
MASTRRRGAELESAILDAGWEQLLEGGYAGFTFEAVAERAQTGKATLYRRWPNKEALVMAVLSHSDVGAPPDVPDTGSLRDDVLSLLRSVNGWGEGAAAVFSTILAAYFDQTTTLPAQLQARLLGGRDRVMPQLIERAIGRGELPGALPARVVHLPLDLFRHELIMNLGRVSEETLVDIVDTVFVPLARAHRFPSPA